MIYKGLRKKTGLKRVVSIIIIFTFIIGCFSEYSWALSSNCNYTKETLSPVLMCDDLAGVQHKDISRIRFAVRSHLEAVNSNFHDGKKPFLDYLKECVGFYKWGGRSLFHPEKVQMFYNEMKYEDENTIRVPCRIKEEGGVRDYYALIGIREVDGSGEIFLKEVYTKEEFVKSQDKLLVLGSRKQKDAFIIRDYERHEEIIDAFIEKAIKAGDFAEIRGRRESLDWGLKFRGLKAVRDSRIWQSNLWEAIRKGTGKDEKTYLDEFLGTFGTSLDKALEGKNLVFIRVHEEDGLPTMIVRIDENGREVGQDEEGKDVEIEVLSHTSENTVYIFLNAEVFDDFYVLPRDATDDIPSGFNFEYIINDVVPLLIHEIGVIYGLGHVFDEIFYNEVFVKNMLDKAWEAHSEAMEKGVDFKTVNAPGFLLMSPELKRLEEEPVDLYQLLSTDRSVFRDYMVGKKKNTPAKKKPQKNISRKKTPGSQKDKKADIKDELFSSFTRLMRPDSEEYYDIFKEAAAEIAGADSYEAFKSVIESVWFRERLNSEKFRKILTTEKFSHFVSNLGAKYDELFFINYEKITKAFAFTDEAQSVLLLVRTLKEVTIAENRNRKNAKRIGENYINLYRIIESYLYNGQKFSIVIDFFNNEIRHALETARNLNLRDVGAFRKNVESNASIDLKSYLKEIDMKKEGINTDVELVKHLRSKAGENGYTEEDVDNAVMALAKRNNVYEFKKQLENELPEEMKVFVRSIDPARLNINTGKELVQYIRSSRKDMTDVIDEAVITLLNSSRGDLIYLMDVLNMQRERVEKGYGEAYLHKKEAEIKKKVKDYKKLNEYAKSMIILSDFGYFELYLFANILAFEPNQIMPVYGNRADWIADLAQKMFGGIGIGGMDIFKEVIIKQRQKEIAAGLRKRDISDEEYVEMAINHLASRMTAAVVSFSVMHQDRGELIAAKNLLDNHIYIMSKMKNANAEHAKELASLKMIREDVIKEITLAAANDFERKVNENWDKIKKKQGIDAEGPCFELIDYANEGIQLYVKNIDLENKNREKKEEQEQWDMQYFTVTEDVRFKVFYSQLYGGLDYESILRQIEGAASSIFKDTVYYEDVPLSEKAILLDKRVLDLYFRACLLSADRMAELKVSDKPFLEFFTERLFGDIKNKPSLEDLFGKGEDMGAVEIAIVRVFADFDKLFYEPTKIKEALVLSDNVLIYFDHLKKMREKGIPVPDKKEILKEEGLFYVYCCAILKDEEKMAAFYGTGGSFAERIADSIYGEGKGKEAISRVYSEAKDLMDLEVSFMVELINLGNLYFKEKSLDLAENILRRFMRLVNAFPGTLSPEYERKDLFTEDIILFYQYAALLNGNSVKELSWTDKLFMEFCYSNIYGDQVSAEELDYTDLYDHFITFYKEKNKEKEVSRISGLKKTYNEHQKKIKEKRMLEGIAGKEVQERLERVQGYMKTARMLMANKQFKKARSELVKVIREDPDMEGAGDILDALDSLIRHSIEKEGVEKAVARAEEEVLVAERELVENRIEEAKEAAERAEKVIKDSRKYVSTVIEAIKKTGIYGKQFLGREADEMIAREEKLVKDILQLKIDIERKIEEGPFYTYSGFFDEANSWENIGAFREVLYEKKARVITKVTVCAALIEVDPERRGEYVKWLRDTLTDMDKSLVVNKKKAKNGKTKKLTKEKIYIYAVLARYGNTPDDERYLNALKRELKYNPSQIIETVIRSLLFDLGEERDEQRKWMEETMEKGVSSDEVVARICGTLLLSEYATEEDAEMLKDIMNACINRTSIFAATHAFIKYAMKVKKEINGMTMRAGQDGLDLPTHPAERYTLFLPAAFFNAGELAECRKEYADRFNLEKVDESDPERFIEKVFYRINDHNENGTDLVKMEYKKTVVLVPAETPDKDLKKLIDNHIRFIRMPMEQIYNVKSVKFLERRIFQDTTFTIMRLIRGLREDPDGDGYICGELLDFYLRSHFDLQDFSSEDYIKAIMSGNLSVLVKGILLFKPAEPYQMPEYDKVAETVIFA